MGSDKICVAVVGASGAVGRQMVSILAERKFPVGDLRLLASQRSAGQALDYDETEFTVELLTEQALQGVDLALFSAGGAISKQWVPRAAEFGALVIDNSSVFRMDDDVPLIVPEVNPKAMFPRPARGIIANPNCSTIQLMLALKPLHDAAGIKRIVVSTYQAVSGAGQMGILELEEQVRAMFNFRESPPHVFPQTIAFNCIPCIPQSDAFAEDGQTTEELKLVNETHKILSPDIAVAVTCVRVPVFNGHAEAVHVELHGPLSPDQARELLGAAPGILVLDNPDKMLYPTQFDISGEDMVAVGRLRADPTVEHGLAMWVVGDNLRKGAALNAVQIAEMWQRDLALPTVPN